MSDAEWLRMENFVVLTVAGRFVLFGGEPMSDVEPEALETASRLHDIPAPVRLSCGVQALR